MSGKEFVTVVKATVNEFNKDDVAYMAAALTYYSFFSLFPLLILAVTVVGLIVERPEHATSFVFNNVDRVLPGYGKPLSEILDEVFKNRSNAGWIALVGLITLVFTASGAFDALDKAINRAWNTEKVPNFLASKLASFTMMAVMAAMLLLSFSVTAILTTTRAATVYLIGELYGEQIFWQVVNFAASLGLVFLVFLLLYRFAPRTDVKFGEVWLAALLMAIAWTLVKEGFAYFVGSAFINYEAVYGPLATIIALLTWIYISSVIILTGAEFAAETARVHRLRPKEAERAAERRASPWLPHS